MYRLSPPVELVRYSILSMFFTETGVTGALAASIFHFGEISIPDLKSQLKAAGIAVR